MDISSIALLIGAAAILATIASQLKQPLLIGYLLAGILLALLGYLHNLEFLEVSSQIGVTLLLFLVGMEMNISELPSLGRVAIITGLGQIFFTSLGGFMLATLLGFSMLPSIYIAVALTFSSTIIMMKLLSEKNDLGSLYGRIAIGFLLVQDLVAMLILMFLSGIETNSMTFVTLIYLVVKAVLLLFIVLIASKYIFPRVISKLSSSNGELLFIVSIAWALAFSVFVSDVLGFTLEIGGFLAGLALSTLPEHLQIASRTRPLRDFFLTIFFLFLGTKLVVGGLGSVVVPALALSVFILVGNPLIMLTIMGFMRYRKRTSFFAGLTVAQISEFSLILMSMGLALGHVGNQEVALVVIVGVVTMTMSTYMIMAAERLYVLLEPYLSVFERKKIKEIRLGKKAEFKDHVVLVGGDRTGREIIPLLKKANIPFVVVDFNPRVFNKLYAQELPAVFGDISDPDILDEINLESARIIVSTVPSLGDNLTLLEDMRRLGAKAASIFISHDAQKAVSFYNRGASMVIVPEMVAGDVIRDSLKKSNFDKKDLKRMGKTQFEKATINLKHLQSA